jgi:hypothetical protein
VTDLPIVETEPGRNAWPPTGSGLLTLAIIALLVAGIASAFTVHSTASPSPLALVQAAGAKTNRAKTAKVSVTAKSDSGIFAKGFSEDGAFDFDNRRFRVAIDMAQFGVTGLGKVDAIADYSNGLIEYVRLPAQVVGQTGGKPWIRIDLNALLRRLGLDVNVGALLQGQAADPTQGLGMVRGAENVVKVGSEQVRGVDTTHYHLDVNFQKAVALAPTQEEQAALQQLVKLYTVPSVPMDLWLDNDGRVRRTLNTLDPSTVRFPPALANESKQLGRVTTTADYYDFGAPVDTTLPAPDQVTDFNQLAGRSGR